MGISLAAILTGCGSDSVKLSFRPPEGTKSTYSITVETDTSVKMSGGPLQHDRSKAVLIAHHTVLSGGSTADQKVARAVRVRVVVEEKGKSDRTFIVRFDRSAQLIGVESEAPSSTDERARTALGLPEIFPAALSAPPNKSMRSGARWSIDRAITLPGSADKTRLIGYGQLSELGIVDNQPVARVAATASLGIATIRPAISGLRTMGELRLKGSQRTVYRATHNLEDGSVRSASSTTQGIYQLVAFPPEGTDGSPATGEMEVVIRSHAQQLN